VARLEEENLTLKERLFLMEQELGDMRRRLEALESRFAGTDGMPIENSDAVAVDHDKEMAHPILVQRDDLRTEIAADAAGSDKASAQDNAEEVADAAVSEKIVQDNADVVVAGSERTGEEIGVDASEMD
jgi:hypothetical protein